MQQSGSICDVPGIKVGHAQDDHGKTGCTVILPDNGAVAGVDIRGSAPGTREVETLQPVRLVPKVHAILLTGGSAFGLDAAGGVQQFLEERNIGYDVGVAKVPIVPAAVIFDLREGDPNIRPDKQMGYTAAKQATSKAPQEGRVGAGRGATVGKVAGYEFRMKGGVGTNSLKLGEILVGCIVVVNAFGDVVDPNSGKIIAGARDSGQFINCAQYLKTHFVEPFPVEPFRAASNTTLAVIATDALLTKEDAIKVAQMAQDGLSRAIRPVHTPYDGDLVFCLSVGNKRGNVTTIGVAAGELVADAIVRAVKIANHLT